MTKHCKNCGKLNENQLLKYCKTCYPIYGKQLNRTKINKVSEKKKERIKNGGSEIEVFRHKLITSQINGDLFCDVCNTRFSIENAKPWCLPHGLNKKDYPHLRLFINNLGIVCSIECHKKFDELVNKAKKDIGNKQLEQLIASGEYVSNLIFKYK